MKFGPLSAILLAAAVLVGAVPAALAADETAPRENPRLRTGPYLGVQPGLKDIAPGKVDVKSRGALRVLTWVGFQMQGAGGRVFLQTTEPAIYNIVASDPGEVVLELTDTRIQSSNDTRRLDTSWFPTAVVSVDARSQKNLVRVTGKLREVVGYDLRQEGNYLFLDFRPPTQAPLAPGGPASTETSAARPSEPAPAAPAP
jgi:hypothetical protein